jgi:hypothetical protein
VRRGTSLLVVAVLAALTLAVMLPRLASPQFGLLDDGITIYVSRALGEAFQGGDHTLVLRLEHERGRFRPCYWLYEAFHYAIWGPSPLGFFIGNTIVLLLTALCVSGTVAIVTGDRLATLLAGIAYVLAPPVFESYYTLSKPEVPLTLWLALSLWGWARARTDAELRPSRSRWPFAVSAATLLLAYLTKETAQAMVLVSTLSVAALWALGRISGSPGPRRVDWWYTGVNVAWAALFWVSRIGSGTASIAAGGDSQRYALTAQSILSSALGHAVWYTRDFALLAPLLAFLWYRGADLRTSPWLLVVPVSWIAGWTAIMLPWPTIYEYFLLPASVPVSILVGLGLAAAFRAVRAPQTSVRTVAILVLTLALACVPLTLASAVTNARIQLAVDDANARAVDVLASEASQDGLVLVDLPPPNEYVDELAIHLRLEGRHDVRVGYLARDAAGSDELTLIARPIVSSRPLPGVRLPVREPGPTMSLDELRTRYGGRVTLVQRVVRQVKLLTVQVPGPLCDVLIRHEAYPDLFCADQRRGIDRRRFRYGWEVHRIHAQ